MKLSKGHKRLLRMDAARRMANSIMNWKYGKSKEKPRMADEAFVRSDLINRMTNYQRNQLGRYTNGKFNCDIETLKRFLTLPHHKARA